MRKRKIAVLSVGIAAFILAITGCSDDSKRKESVTVTIWNYYNEEQLDAFNERVDEFNKTVGEKQGIVVESYSQGSMTDLESNLIDSALQKAGAYELPNIFSAYADTTYTLDQMGVIADLNEYLTEEEREEYIDSYLSEGDFTGDGSIKILPVVKSTEILCINATDWEVFSEATGVSYQNLETIEGVIDAAEIYYQWTDAQTQEENDGCALFGRDAMANYMLIGAKQLGCTIFEVEDGKMTLNFDKEVVRKLWDCYYVPFIKGYFAASGRFRSDDIRIGNILMYQGSSTSVSFFPSSVIKNETEEYDIQLKVLPVPKFDGGENVVVQQGAGMSVTAGDEEEIEASVTFLKWFTQPENNIQFSVNSGYLPVTKYANDIENVNKMGLEVTDSMRDVLEVAFDTVNSNELYTTRAFEDGQSARQVLNYALSDQANQDRMIVEERINQGMSREDAMAEFLTEDAFENWYQTTLEALEQYE